MSYEPTVWAANDVITAAKMNKIEQGIENSSGGGSLIVNVIEESATNGGTRGASNNSTYRFNKTAGEVINAINNGAVVWLFGEAADEEAGITAQNKSLLTGMTVTAGDSGSTYEFMSNGTYFEATSLDDYPTTSNS